MARYEKEKGAGIKGWDEEEPDEFDDDDDSNYFLPKPPYNGVRLLWVAQMVFCEPGEDPSKFEVHIEWYEEYPQGWRSHDACLILSARDLQTLERVRIIVLQHTGRTIRYAPAEAGGAPGRIAWQDRIQAALEAGRIAYTLAIERRRPLLMERERLRGEAARLGRRLTPVG